MRRRKQSGQAILLVVVASGILLVGAMGLAVDGATLYAHRQMAQSAADAAAQAAIMSIFSGTDTVTTTGSYTCPSSLAGSPATYAACQYASKNGFSSSEVSVSYCKNGAASCVTFGSSADSGVTLSPDFSPAAAHVAITRQVATTLIGMLGGSATTVKAVATAVIVRDTVPVPMIITHPFLSGSFSMGGGGSASGIKFCGGPQQSIQVNSSSTTALSINNGSTVDLHKAGPADDGTCSSGTGSDFGVFGDTQYGTGLPSFLTGCTGCAGTTTHYIQPSPPIPDPLMHVDPPTAPATSCPGSGCGTATAPSTTVCSNIAPGVACTADSTGTLGTSPGTGDCPGQYLADGVTSNPFYSSNGCILLTPGYYPTGIWAKGITAVFQPGVYYIGAAPTSGTNKNIGFGTGANGFMVMCGYGPTGAGTGTCTADTSGNFTQNGMMVYLNSAGGTQLNEFTVGANGGASLKGSDPGSVYKNILFFVDRNAQAQTHNLGGGGALAMQGTVYAANCASAINAPNAESCAVMTSSLYQTLQLSGGSGQGTTLTGQIIVSTVSVKGSGSITMNLSSLVTYNVNHVALVDN
jgi:hypothetical protein